MAAKFAVTGDQFVVIDDRMREIKRQLRLKGGSPLDPERVAKALQSIVDGLFEAVAPPIAWRTIVLGTNNDASAYHTELERCGYKIIGDARDFLTRVNVVKSSVGVNLIRITVKGLGFPEGASTVRVFAAAAARGLHLCPAEVGPALRLFYPDQPNGERIYIGMDPITYFDGRMDVFVVGHSSWGQCLDVSNTRPGHRWHPESVWVFLLGK